MKMHISLMKLTIRLLVLMVLFVILFLILAVLYSSRYWPDVYNYINANITIKRIPTLSELNLTILEVDATTEFYTTIEDYPEASTVEGFDIDIDDFTNSLDDLQISKRSKRYALEEFGKDYSELPRRNVIVDYLFLEDSTVHEGVIVTKIVKDLIEGSKLVPKNYGDVEVMNSLNEVETQKLTDSPDGANVSIVLPWVTTIFVKNDTKSNQFEYTCDGALVHERVLITAARCVTKGNSTAEVGDLLVVLGKRSLRSMADKEKTVKIKQIIIHENFTNENGNVKNDLALLFLEVPVAFNDIVQPANIGNDTEEVEKSFTTAWNLQGDLVPVALESKKVKACGNTNGRENMFCAAYGQDVPLCPSYGGIFAGLQDSSWHLYGIRSGDVTDKGLCFNKNVWFTDLRPYGEWIEEYLE